MSLIAIKYNDKFLKNILIILLLNDNNFNAFIYLNLKFNLSKKKFQMILSKNQ